MREQAKPITIPFDKGHYGGFDDVAATMITANKIPLGYYYGTDVKLDDSGFLRARPKLSYLVTYGTSAYNPIGCFKLGGTYYSFANSAALQYYTGSAWAAVTGSPTYTSQVNVDDISAAGNTTPLAFISSCYNNPKIYTVTGSAATEIAAAQAKGIASHDEGRIFCFNDGYIYYSDRGAYTTGYATGASGEWFLLGNSCDTPVAMFNCGGALNILQCNTSAEKIYLWRKTQTYSDSEELIDMTSFKMVYGAFNGVINNKTDGVCQLGGNIFAWISGVGLAVLTDNGFQILSEEIYAETPSNLIADCIIAADERSKQIFVKRSGDAFTMVYDFRSHNWQRWNVNITGKGWGSGGGMFSVAGTLSPARLGSYATAAAEDSTIVPIVFTSAMNLGYPMREKFIDRLYINGTGITEVLIYCRLRPEDSFVLWKTCTVTDKLIRLDGDNRFGEVYFKISGNNLFCLKSFGIGFTVGDEIWEGS